MELSTKLNVELINGVAEYGSGFNALWHGTIMETDAALWRGLPVPIYSSASFLTINSMFYYLNRFGVDLIWARLRVPATKTSDLTSAVWLTSTRPSSFGKTFQTPTPNSDVFGRKCHNRPRYDTVLASTPNPPAPFVISLPPAGKGEAVSRKPLHLPTWPGAHPNAFFDANTGKLFVCCHFQWFSRYGPFITLQVRIYTTYGISAVGGCTDLVCESSDRIFWEYGKRVHKLLFLIIQKILTIHPPPGAHPPPCGISGNAGCKDWIKGSSKHIFWGE